MTTITVDYASRSARVSGVVCLGETVDFQVAFEDGGEDAETLPSEAEVVIYGDNNDALTVAPALDADWKGVINLRTDEAKALFVGKKTRDRITLSVGVWNATDKRMLGLGPVSVSNNPAEFSSDSVTELLTEYFGARILALENGAGKIPRFDNPSTMVPVFVIGDGDSKQITFEVPE